MAGGAQCVGSAYCCSSCFPSVGKEWWATSCRLDRASIEAAASLLRLQLRLEGNSGDRLKIQVLDGSGSNLSKVGLVWFTKLVPLTGQVW